MELNAAKIQPIMIYLAGPIDDIDVAEAKAWREAAGHGLPTGIVLFSPVHAYRGEVTQVTAPKVDFMNRVNIAFCDGMIANLSGPGRGFGTIREVEFARSRDKPVAVIGGDPLVSLMSFDILVAADFDDALTEVMQAIQEGRNAPRGTMISLPFLQPPPIDE